MKTMNMVLSGLGGQGILFMTKVLAQAALDKGLNVIGAETHGMAQRGGSVVSHLRLGDVQSSLVKTGSAHFLLSLEENEAYRNIPFLARGGRLYANTSSEGFPRKEVRPYLENMGIVCRAVPASRVASKMRAPMSSNLALLGFFSAFEDGPVGYDDLKKTIDKVSPSRSGTINLKVFDAGFQRGTQQRE